MAPEVGYWNLRGVRQILYVSCVFWFQHYIDGDVKLSQSFAIMKYLGRKHDLAPKTEEEKIRVDLTEGEVMDMRFNWSTLPRKQ